MYIILSIYSKNLNSLTNFLKFFYKLKTNKAFNLKFYSIQSQQKDRLSFFSTLQSPHVNKKSQEQFEYSLHNKRLKIQTSQMIKFLTIWKLIKSKMFLDIEIEIEFWAQKKLSQSILLTKLDCDRFRSKFFKKKVVNFTTKRFPNQIEHCRKQKNNFFVSKISTSTFLKLLDIHGEALIKNFIKSLDSSVGRAKDWKSLWRQFKPVSKHLNFCMKNTLWNISAHLKNNQISQRNWMYQPKTNLVITFLNILWDEGFILGYKIDNSDSSLLKIFLKYKNGNPVITTIKSITKPSRRIYYSVSQLWKLESKKSLIILTTAKGLMTAYECKKNQIGGKPIFMIK